MATDTLAIKYLMDGVQKISSSVDQTNSLRQLFEEAVATATTNQPMRLAFLIANLKSLLMSTDQDVTIVTNSSGSPVDTFHLKANKPFVWTADFLVATTRAQNPFSVDVTEMFLTNASGFTANLTVEALVNGSV